MPLLVVLVPLSGAVGAGCGADESPAPAPSLATEPSATVDDGTSADGDGGAEDDGPDAEAPVEFVITDVFTASDTGRVILVGYVFAGSLRRGQVVETFTVGPTSRTTVLHIDRVTPSPLEYDVDRLLEGQTGNVELSDGVADDYLQGQTLIAPV